MPWQPCTDPACDFTLDFRPCAELGGHGAVSGGACPATHCRLHLGRDRMGLGKHYSRAEDTCLLHLIESLEAMPSSMAETAEALGLAKTTVARIEAEAGVQVRAAGLDLARVHRKRPANDQIISPQRLTRKSAAG